MSKKKPLVVDTAARRRIDALSTKLKDACKQIEVQDGTLAEDLGSLTELESKVSRLEEQYELVIKQLSAQADSMNKHNEASGGFWRTSKGVLMRFRDMSDTHVANILSMFPGNANALKEQDRRKEDLMWARQTRPLQTLPDPTPGYVHAASGSIAIAKIRKIADSCLGISAFRSHELCTAAQVLERLLEDAK